MNRGQTKDLKECSDELAFAFGPGGAIVPRIALQIDAQRLVDDLPLTHAPLHCGETQGLVKIIVNRDGLSTLIHKVPERTWKEIGAVVLPYW